MVNNKVLQKRRYHQNQQQNKLEVNNKLDIKSINYKNYQHLISLYLTNIHTIKGSNLTTFSRKMQKQLTKSISYARFLSLIPTRGNKI